MVPMAFTSGVIPLRIDENMYIGNVVFGPATENEIMKSSKLGVKLSRKPTNIAGIICGRVA